jgi:hypothetical protein
MPLSLGLGAAGKAASALGGSGKGGPTSTLSKSGTSSTATTGSQGGTNTPNLNPIMAGFQNSLVPALSSMYEKAQTPVYGQQQIAQVANAGDAATNAASDALTSNLARRGVLNSGAAASGETALAQGNESNTVGFENQIPLLNYQNEMAQTGNVLGLAEGLTGKALSTNTSTASNQGTTTGTNSSLESTTGPAFASSLLSQSGNVLGNAGAAGKGGGGKGGGVSPGFIGSDQTPGATGALGDFLSGGG